MAAVKCHVLRKRFFLCRKSGFVLLFSDPMVVGLSWPLVLQKAVSSAAGSDGSFLLTAYTRKNVLFGHSTPPRP